MTNWTLAQSLRTLRSQINAEAFHRDTASDGTIGDIRHVAEGGASDHNPHLYEGGWWVCALDITNDPAQLPGKQLAESLRLCGDSRLKYVIWNKRIFFESNRAWTDYHGQDPHTSHVHISVQLDHDSVDHVFPWSLPVFSAFRERPVLKLATTGAPVRVVQSILGQREDGIFGKATDNAVRAFQKEDALITDGVIGAHTWDALIRRFDNTP